jgi:hypothetical protein
MVLRILFISIWLCLLNYGYAQNNTVHKQDDYIIETKKATGIIKIDGVLDETIWQELTPATNFWNKFPTNNTHAEKKTEVRITYNDNYLYIGAICYENSSKHLVQTLKRDKGLRVADGFAIVLDPYNQKSSGFYFGVNTYNAQSEDLLAAGVDQLSFSWDNTWYSKTKVYNDKWTVEMAIPFNVLRYDPNKKNWGINFIRSNRIENQFHTWTQVPLQFPGVDLGYLGKLIWDNTLPKTNSKVSINPYTSTGVNIDKENNENKGLLNAGVDAKIALTPSLNLDLTVNPDFSQVDVDRQITNLSRFSIFFPERRGFFLENDDLFSSYGIPPIRPFYSRRIGSSNGVQVPILFGARLTGNINKSTRIGLLNMQTGKKDGEAAENFTAATFNKAVLSRSFIKGYVLNKESFISNEEKLLNPISKFARNGGIEFSYSDKEGLWNAWYGHHVSIKPTIKNQNQYISGGAGYFGTTFSSFAAVDVLGTNYYTDMGFTERILNYDAEKDTSFRRGFRSLYSETSYSLFFTKHKKLNRFKVEFNPFVVYTSDGSFNEFSFENKYSLEFKNSANISIAWNSVKEQLLYPSKFVEDDNALPIPVGKYNYNQVELEANTDRRKDFSIAGNIALGKYYNADYKKYKVEIEYRRQPKLTLNVSAEYNQLNFPEIYGKETFWLIAPNIEYNFSTNLFWTTFLQYNTQNNNVNINSRLQWRYKPMSDLFLVYTDNYFTDPLFKNKNRGIVLKVNYWLNL